MLHFATKQGQIAHRARRSSRSISTLAELPVLPLHSKVDWRVSITPRTADADRLHTGVSRFRRDVASVREAMPCPTAVR
jgi:hypothetical protein